MHQIPVTPIHALQTPILHHGVHIKGHDTSGNNFPLRRTPFEHVPGPHLHDHLNSPNGQLMSQFHEQQFNESINIKGHSFDTTPPQTPPLYMPLNMSSPMHHDHILHNGPALHRSKEIHGLNIPMVTPDYIEANQKHLMYKNFKTISTIPLDQSHPSYLSSSSELPFFMSPSPVRGSIPGSFRPAGMHPGQF